MVVDMAIIVMEAAMVAAENSDFKDKKKMREFLYQNPDKLGVKLQKFLINNNGELLEPVRLKGNGTTYRYSYYEKKHIPCPSNSEYYLLNWKAEKDDECYVYTHYNWMMGAVLKVKKDDLIFLGFN